MNVLIVDDSRAMRMIVARTLRQMSVQVRSITEAGDGTEALPLVAANRYDLIICDWNMPQMNGMELLRELRKSGVDTRFGFCTSEATPEMRVQGMQAGAQFFVTKPFTAESFQFAMKAA